jgi:cytidylate kinase
MPEQAPRVIALDGPAAAGKSTVGRRLAARLGHLYLDTGAIYRAVTLAALERGVPVEDAAALTTLARGLDLVVEPAPDPDDPTGYIVRIDGRDVTRRLRGGDVDANVSAVSRHASVRAVLLEMQRAVAAHQGVVMVGRDIGTVVLPDADLKLYLDASAQERARRRYREGLARGEAQRWQDVLAATQARDDRDSGRDVAPLRPAADAVIVSTDGCDLPAVVAHLVALVARWPDPLTQAGGKAPCAGSSISIGSTAAAGAT